MELQLFDKQVPVSKSGVAKIASALKENILNGEINVFEFISKVEILKNALEELRKDRDVVEAVLSEVEKYGREGEWREVKIKQIEAGTKYDFSMTGDPVILQLLKKQEELKEKMKEREKFLKNIPYEGITELDEETGEYSKIYPPVKSSTTTFSITLPKR
jgi:hypothetical protein